MTSFKKIAVGAFVLALVGAAFFAGKLTERGPVNKAGSACETVSLDGFDHMLDKSDKAFVGVIKQVDYVSGDVLLGIAHGLKALSGSSDLSSIMALRRPALADQCIEQKNGQVWVRMTSSTSDRDYGFLLRDVTGVVNQELADKLKSGFGFDINSLTLKPQGGNDVFIGNVNSPTALQAPSDVQDTATLNGLATLSFMNGDFKASVPHLTRLAEAGDIVAMRKLSFIYDKHLPDKAEAYFWRALARDLAEKVGGEVYTHELGEVRKLEAELGVPDRGAAEQRLKQWKDAHPFWTSQLPAADAKPPQ